jgi:glutathione S-transferase
VHEHDRRTASGDAVDDAATVQLDVPLLELRARTDERAQSARGPVLAGLLTLAESQRGTSSASLAKGHTQTAVLRLVTIPISHYCEKARWGLERAGMPYREEPHVQGIHRLAARRAGGRGTVPVLVTPQGAIADSAEILEWIDARIPAERRLFPPEPERLAEVRALCARLDEVLGPAGRRLIYVHMLAQRELMLDFNNQGVPRWEDRALRLGWPLAVGFVSSALGIRPGVEVQDEEIVWRELDHVAGLLGDGRPYLLGERFGAADLTFAALCAPVLLPTDYGVVLPQPEVVAPATAALVMRAREHPAGRHALRMIAEQRHALPAPLERVR